MEGLCSTYNCRLRHSKSTYRLSSSSATGSPAVNTNNLSSKEKEKRNDNDDDEVIIFLCTELSVAKILESIYCLSTNTTNANSKKPPLSPPAEEGKLRFENCTKTIINRSEIVGWPLACMLANDGAKVYSIDETSILLFERTRSNNNKDHDDGELPQGQDHQHQMIKVKRISDHTKHVLCEYVSKSNIIVTGVPNNDFQLPLSAIRNDCTLINVSHVPNVDEIELGYKNELGDVIDNGNGPSSSSKKTVVSTIHTTCRKSYNCSIGNEFDNVASEIFFS